MDLIETFAEDPRIAVRDARTVDPDGRCVIYWMRRAQRALENPALETAIAIANALEKPIVVFFALCARHPRASLRHYTFMIEETADTAARLERHHIGFVMRLSEDRRAANDFARFAAEMRPAAIVTDRSPLSSVDSWRRAIPEEIRVPVLNVDANAIVPTALLGREHSAARTSPCPRRGRQMRALRELCRVRSAPLCHSELAKNPDPNPEPDPRHILQIGV